MENKPVSPGRMGAAFYARVIFFALLWMLVFFLPAGTLAFWEAWVVLGILVIPMLVSYPLFLKKDAETIQRRGKTEEKEAGQKSIIKLLSLLFIFTFLIPGFDRRFDWSTVPLAVVILADVVLAIGFGICFLAIWQNRYAGRTIEVEGEQGVISSGLYGMVRHPMYMGMLLMCIALPLALGSWWALIPASCILPVLVARLLNEESLLIRELKGYPEYMQKVKNRLIPGVW